MSASWLYGVYSSQHQDSHVLFVSRLIELNPIVVQALGRSCSSSGKEGHDLTSHWIV